MKIVVILLICFFSCSLCFTPPTPEVYYISQRVSHFNAELQDTFQQRYFIYSGYWNGKGPILFYTGNEGALEEFCKKFPSIKKKNNIHFTKKHKTNQDDNTGLQFFFGVIFILKRIL